MCKVKELEILVVPPRICIMVNSNCELEIDKGGPLGNFFWEDAKSRRGYSHFGDVIVFDITFNTNV